jgi:hypothetical protein
VAAVEEFELLSLRIVIDCGFQGDVGKGEGTGLRGIRLTNIAGSLGVPCESKGKVAAITVFGDARLDNWTGWLFRQISRNCFVWGGGGLCAV